MSKMEVFWSRISNVKLSKKSKNTETYEANMKILIKKVKMKNENEIFYFKNKINEKEKKIYDIIEDNNILYIIYDINEDIDELINNNTIKEKEAIISYEPIKKDEIFKLFEKELAICKIKFKEIKNNKIEDMKGTGFFLNT